MDKDEIEKRIIICDERARGYLEVGKSELADKYYTEKHKWEKLLSDLDLLNDRKINELLEYKRGYFSLVDKCEKYKGVIDNVFEFLKLYGNYNGVRCTRGFQMGISDFNKLIVILKEVE